MSIIKKIMRKLNSILAVFFGAFAMNQVKTFDQPTESKTKFNNRISQPHPDHLSIATFGKMNARNNRLFRDRRKAAQSYIFQYSSK